MVPGETNFRRVNAPPPHPLPPPHACKAATASSVLDARQWLLFPPAGGASLVDVEPLEELHCEALALEGFLLRLRYEHLELLEGDAAAIVVVNLDT